MQLPGSGALCPGQRRIARRLAAIERGYDWVQIGRFLLSRPGTVVGGPLYRIFCFSRVVMACWNCGLRLQSIWPAPWISDRRPVC